LAKIAVKLPEPIERLDHQEAAPPARKYLARGEGWTVADLICHAGPRDRSFEEQHASVGIGIVTQGSFQYRSSPGRELMFPGSLLLGNAGQYFECSHEHGVGDRCIAVAYDEHYFESLAAEAEIHTRTRPFPLLRLPPLRELASLTSRACAQVRQREAQAELGDEEHAGSSAREAWEEMVLELASRAIELANSGRSGRESSLAAESRVTRVVRMIEARGGTGHNLVSLAREAKLSRYHFLRVFQHLTALTPHQYLLRTRLRSAATRLMLRRTPILEIALDCGFGDVSNFNHAFRAEFGVKPSDFRKLRRAA